MKPIWMVMVLMAATCGLTSAQPEIVIDGQTVIKGGITCGEGQALVGFNADGTEICTCQSGLSSCGSACFDLQSDLQNCGGCGNVCAPGLFCNNGYCDECDYLQNDCPDSGEACYFSAIDGGTVCATPFIETGDGKQGDVCSLVNGCAEGYSCVLLNEFDLVCARHCDSEETLWNPVCESEAGAGARCVNKTDFYNDVDRDDHSFCAPAF